MSEDKPVMSLTEAVKDIVNDPEMEEPPLYGAAMSAFASSGSLLALAILLWPNIKESYRRWQAKGRSPEQRSPS
jgi:hypothetical protein